ncbi:MAG: molybdopterin-dependent oxidoreductase, partial [Bacteroidales bacterium]|nr:molybdopterin-dependent oxidoreductase [Bacteroidales bacterium]
RAIKIEGNPLHPLNQGKTCARGQSVIQGLYNPDRIIAPLLQNRSANLSEDKISWDDSISTLSNLIQNTPPDQIGILLGDTHDHLYDLLSKFTQALRAPMPVRFSALSMFAAENTLKKLDGTGSLPHFDIGTADLILSFGANFLETWLSPVAYTREYANFRKGQKGKRGYMVHFEPRMSQTAAVADEWFPIIPGTEAFAALALGRLIAELQGQLPDSLAGIDPDEMATKAGIQLEKLQLVAEKFFLSAAPLAIPGNFALGQTNGDLNAAAILQLNSLASLDGKPNLVTSGPKQVMPVDENTQSALLKIQELIKKMDAGEVKLLLVHGVNPVFDIPASFGFEKALNDVGTIVSFSSFPDETALLSDYIFPDHTNLESWGYQQVTAGTQSQVFSGLQPVVVPFYSTKSTVDVVLAAVQSVGGSLAQALPYSDEVQFLQSRLQSLLGLENDLIRAGDIKTFSAQFQQYGGWWISNSESNPIEASDLGSPEEVVYQGEGEFYLHPFISPILGDKGANLPWLQETPDPTTTVMWNTWIEINPKTAEELGIHDDDIVKLITPEGEIEASVYLYPAIRPDTIGIPYGQGHTAYGRYAQSRGANPADLLGMVMNDAGDLVFATTKVKLEKTGKHKQLARLESRIGVYGFGEEH